MNKKKPFVIRDFYSTKSGLFFMLSVIAKKYAEFFLVSIFRQVIVGIVGVSATPRIIVDILYGENSQYKPRARKTHAGSFLNW
jgi:hypothetical protein